MKPFLIIILFLFFNFINSAAQNYGFDGKMKCITSGGRNIIWGLSNDGRVWRWDGRAWQENFANYRFEQISVASDGALWLINDQHNIYRFADSRWLHLQGELKYIAASSAGSVWGLNEMGEVWHWTGTNWEYPNDPIQLKQLDVAADGSAWGVNNADNIFRWTGNSWQPVPGSMQHVTVGSSNSVWGVNNNNEVFRWTGTTWEQPVRNVRLRQVDIASDGTLWGINSANDIFMWDGASWIYMTTTNSFAATGNYGVPPSSPSMIPGSSPARYPGRSYSQPSGDASAIARSNQSGIPLSDAITLYWDSNYEGASLQLSGDWTTSMNASWNDQISSIRIPAGYKIQVFENDNFYGRSRILTGDWAGDYDFNDRISSIRILEGNQRKHDGGVTLSTEGKARSNATQEEQKRRGRNRNTDYTPTPVKTNCSASAAEYDNLTKAIKSNSFSAGKLETAKNGLAGKCFSIEQLRGVVALFSFEDQKLTFLKYAYDFTDNKPEYYTLTDVFTFNSSKTNFNEFLKNK